jgi:hypothetical protein
MQHCTEPLHPPLRNISYSHSCAAEDSKLLTEGLNLLVKRHSNLRAGLLQEDEVPRFRDKRNMKVENLSALCTDPVQRLEIFVVLSSLRGRVYTTSGRLMSMKKSNDAIGNWTRKLPACSAVSQQIAPPRTPEFSSNKMFFRPVSTRCRLHVAKFVKKACIMTDGTCVFHKNDLRC